MIFQWKMGIFPLKIEKNYGTSPFLMGKSTIKWRFSRVFRIKMVSYPMKNRDFPWFFVNVYQRVYGEVWWSVLLSSNYWLTGAFYVGNGRVAGGCWDDEITSDEMDHSRNFPAFSTSKKIMGGNMFGWICDVIDGFEDEVSYDVIIGMWVKQCYKPS